MSRRTQSIRSMFAAKDEGAEATERAPALHRESGAVRAMRDTFSNVEKDYQLLREQLAAGQVAVELDAGTIDPSPYSDRFADQDESSFQALVASIAERGQEIPVLVRPHPNSPGRYQSAYGHRRVRALLHLERPVKAYVRNLSDEDLALAQGIENSAREDLSFIERGVFAQRLEDAGFQRSVIQGALSVDRAEASKLISVARLVPSELVQAIGRSPRIGRGRWQALAEALKSPDALDRAKQATNARDFAGLDSDKRFAVVMAAASSRSSQTAARANAAVVMAKDGKEIARLSVSSKASRIQFDRGYKPAFAQFVMNRLPGLLEDFLAEEKEDAHPPAQGT